VAHGVWLDDDDMARLGDQGASIAHNPGSNMRLGAGLADARAMLDARVNLGIGTDGANCSDNQNMYEAMRLASFVSKVQGPEMAALDDDARSGLGGDPGQRPRPQLRRPHRPDRARLPADLVLLDLDHPNWLPFNDPVNQLVTAKTVTRCTA